MSDPEYTLRVSRRAKHVRLRMDDKLQLQITVPVGFDTREIPDILERKRDWIEQARQRLQDRVVHREESETLPESIHLQACDEHWQVRYLSHGKAKATLTAQSSDRQNRQNRLICHLPRHLFDDSGQVTDQAFVREMLRQWLLARARDHLQPKLDDWSETLRLPYQGLRIRTQKTRWGSCSSKGNINLNAHLMFLPPHWVEHVLIHEVCHLRHPNHSHAFWDLVAQYDPQFQNTRREMKNAWQFIPAWSLTTNG